MPGVLYVDASALVKLVVEEPESEALERELRAWPLRVSSVVTAVEVPRAARRGSDDPAIASRADELVRRLTLLELDREVIELAAAIQPPMLRSLDAIHLASALSLGRELEGLLTYDSRLAGAATAGGVRLITPR